MLKQLIGPQITMEAPSAKLVEMAWSSWDIRMDIIALSGPFLRSPFGSQ